MIALQTNLMAQHMIGAGINRQDVVMTFLIIVFWITSLLTPDYQTGHMSFGWSHGVWSIFNVPHLHLVKVWNIEKYSTAGKGSAKDTVYCSINLVFLASLALLQQVGAVAETSWGDTPYPFPFPSLPPFQN